jgi:uncharacterized protein (DUF58 family)
MDEPKAGAGGQDVGRGGDGRPGAVRPADALRDSQPVQGPLGAALGGVARAVRGGRPAEAPPPEADASLYLHPQTLARLSSFELRAKMIVEGVMSGMHRSPYHGFSVEFAQHRPYVPGDDIRHLDWKVYARSDKLHLKQYQQETSLDLVVLVDASGSMRYGSRQFEEASGAGHTLSPDGRPNWSKFDHATAAAAAMAYVTLQQGDRAGLFIFSDEVRGMVKRSSSQGTWRQIVGALASHYQAQPANAPTDVGRVIDQVIAKLNNRCLLVLISDLFTDLEELRAGLARVRHRRHDMIIFQVLDQREKDFDFRDSVPFEGLEGEPRLRIDPRALRDGYLKALHRHLDQVEKTARSFGFDYHLVNTHEWLGPSLAAFVARRNAQIKRSKYG